MTTTKIVEAAKEIITPIDWKKTEVTYGADPELVFQYKGMNVHATDILRGLDTNEYVPNAEGGTIGVDASGRPAEIRPRYDVDPKKVVQNIQKTLINEINRRPELSVVDWTSGSSKNKEAIGGHIHVGINQEKWGNLNLTMAMDIFLSINVMHLEIPSEGFARKMGQYGHLGDIRQQKWGIEYRTLPSWLYSPAVALAVLSLAKHVVNQSLINGKAFKNLNAKEIFGVDYTDVKNKFNQHDTNFFKENLEVLWDIINTWPVDPKVEDGLKMFIAMLNNDYTFGDGDFKHNWGINFVKEPPGANGATLDQIFGGVRV